MSIASIESNLKGLTDDGLYDGKGILALLEAKRIVEVHGHGVVYNRDVALIRNFEQQDCICDQYNIRSFSLLPSLNI